MTTLISPIQPVTQGLPENSQAVEAAARLFRGLGDPTRIRILALLLEGERSVSDLVQALGSPQGRVSSHLACLRWCGFVEPRREGRSVYYAIADHRVRNLLEMGNGILVDAAERLLSCQVLDEEARG